MEATSTIFEQKHVHDFLAVGASLGKDQMGLERNILGSLHSSRSTITSNVVLRLRLVVLSEIPEKVAMKFGKTLMSLSG